MSYLNDFRWGVSSCTTKLEILDSNQFLGKKGERTIFSIQCLHGKSVKPHSHFKQHENEVILKPGSCFKVQGRLNPAEDLHIVELQEIEPQFLLVAPPGVNVSHINSIAPPTGMLCY